MKFWVSQLNRAYSRADPGLLTPLADEGCFACASAVDEVRELKTRGQHYRGSALTVHDSIPLGTDAEGLQRVRLVMSQAPLAVVDRNGETVSRISEEHGGATFAARLLPRRPAAAALTPADDGLTWRSPLPVAKRPDVGEALWTTLLTVLQAV